MKKSILVVCMVWLIVLIFAPAAMAGQYQWQVSTDQQGNIHEIISIQDMEADLDLEGWNSSSGEGTLILERVNKDWDEYSAAPNGLPVTAETKNYLIFSTTTLRYSQSSQPGLFDDLISMADGDINIQVAGIIQESSAAEIDNLNQDPTAIWRLTSEQSKNALAQAPIFLQVITFDGLAISLTILLFGITGITIWYLTYIRRVNKLIEEEYSLSNIEKLLEKEEEEEKENN